MKVDVPILDSAVCQRWFNDNSRPFHVADAVVCAGYEHGGKDACTVNNNI